jgi:hypothetical protein
MEYSDIGHQFLMEPYTVGRTIAEALLLPHLCIPISFQQHVS